MSRKTGLLHCGLKNPVRMVEPKVLERTFGTNSQSMCLVFVDNVVLFFQPIDSKHLWTYDVSPSIPSSNSTYSYVPRTDGKFITLFFSMLSPRSFRLIRLLISCPPLQNSSVTMRCIEKNEENRHCFLFTTFGRVVTLLSLARRELWCALVWEWIV